MSFGGLRGASFLKWGDAFVSVIACPPFHAQIVIEITPMGDSRFAERYLGRDFRVIIADALWMFFGSNGFLIQA